jgi:hypothetical protein
MRRYKTRTPICFTNKNLEEMAMQHWWWFTAAWCCLSLVFATAWIAVLLEVNYFWF